MERLPELAIGNIAKFLSAKEIGVCCATSTSWRAMFNQDRVWRPFCNQAMAAHLKVTACRVEPGFVSPEPEDSSLSGICEWRLCYMRQVHLWSNWRHGRKIEEFFEPLRDKHFQFIKFLNDSQVLIKVKNEKHIMLWDVKEKPTHLHDPVTLALKEDVDLCEIFQDKIIFIQEEKIQIYKVNIFATAAWELQGVYILPLTHSYYFSAIITSNLLVVLNEHIMLQIFDLKQLKTIKVSKTNLEVADNSHYGRIVPGGKGSMHFTLLVEDILLQITCIYIYSIENLDFIKFNIPIYRNYVDDCHLDLDEDFLTILYDGSIQIYKYLTSELVLNVPNPFTFSKTVEVNDYLSYDLYCRDLERDSGVNSEDSQLLLIDKSMSGFIPKGCHCLGFKTCEIDRLLVFVKEHKVFPTEVVSIGFLDPEEEFLFNNIYTKCMRYLKLETFW